MDDRSCDPALAASAPPATAAAAAQVNALPQYFPVTAVAASAPRCSSGMPLTGAPDVAAQASAAHLTAVAQRKIPLPFREASASGVFVPTKKRVRSSRFRGVSWHKSSQKWRAVINIDSERKNIGSYDDEAEAARAYDATVRAQSLDRPLNFPDDLSTAPGVYVPKKKRVATSRFRGVSWYKMHQKWVASTRIDGKSKHIGFYDDETEAARAYDATVRAHSLDRPLNFPDE